MSQESAEKMINTIVKLQEIHYETKAPGILLESIRKRGMAIPVQCNARDGYYECVDGNRRLSALALLAKEDPKYERVEILILNDYSKAGSSFWGNTQNLH
jgi:ParB-like chromosome segregation protein Spo0J